MRALTASRKALVTRLGELTAAEAKIVDLQAEADAAVFRKPMQECWQDRG